MMLTVNETVITEMFNYPIIIYVMVNAIKHYYDYW